MSKKPNQTEANRSEPTSINHHPKAFMFSCLLQLEPLSADRT
ncbi:hypothetical protein COLO4_35366 [Corchorus olitorius]|uniref:Uncharacterized protein n=1 Tax=Corchorus olitorius TaxID=93759 RepID=A0A1R3GHC2_9ROSI|nr:hypothetical protein COLO4_35366 [Corchorus olitorius]